MKKNNIVKKTKKIETKTCNTSLDIVLLRKATGYTVQEIVEEYSYTDDEEKLVKKKVSEKYYPPDLSALQYLLEQNKTQQDFTKLTDAELDNEINLLLQKLENMNNRE